MQQHDFETDPGIMSQQTDSARDNQYMFNNYDLHQKSNQNPSSMEPNGDILGAYKELKKILVKNQGSKMGADQADGPKNYLRTTIAMQQHSVKRMNKELLRYSLQQPRKYFLSNLIC